MNLMPVTDLNLIIFLVTKNHQIKDSKVDGNKTIIYFENSKKLQKDIMDFANGTETINITDYQAVEQRIKILIYQNKNK